MLGAMLMVERVPGMWMEDALSATHLWGGLWRRTPANQERSSKTTAAKRACRAVMEGGWISLRNSFLLRVNLITR